MLAERLLAPVRDAGVDTLLLGCTHYPYLARTISDVMGRDVVLVSSADETAFEVAGRARARPGSAQRDRRPRPGRHRFLSSGDVDVVPPSSGGRLLGPELADVEARHGIDGMALSVTVLGCSGTLRRPRATRAAATWCRRRHDASGSTGPGTLANLQQHIGSTTIDAVVAEPQPSRPLARAPVLRNALQYALPGRGPAGVSARPRRASCVDIVVRRRSSRRSSGRSSPTATASTIGDLRLLVLAHRPPGRDAGRAHRRREGSLAGLLGRHRARLVARRARPRRSTSRCARPRSLAESRGQLRRTCSARQAGTIGSGAPAWAAWCSPTSGRPRPDGARGRGGRGLRSPVDVAVHQRDVHRMRTRRPDADPTAAQPDELRPITFERDFTERPPARCSCRSAAPGCCAPRRSTRTCPAGCGATARAGSPPSTRCCPGSSPERIRREVDGGQAVGAHPGDPAADRPVAAGGHATWRRSASGRSSSTATCCRPTAARAPRRSAAATSRCTTR